MGYSCGVDSLDKVNGTAYNVYIKGVAEKRLRPRLLFQFMQPKPSLARVAVSAFYRDRDGIPKHMKGQCNRHYSTPFRVVWRNRLFTLGNALPLRATSFYKSIHDLSIIL